MMEAYFDESGTDDGSPVMCVAGYLFEQEAAIAMTKKWVAMLHKYEVPFIHMKELAPCKGVCEHLGMDHCDLLEREALALIHEYMTVGYAISVDTKFEHLIPRFNQYDNIYTFACWQALLAIRNWANNERYKGEISYFFEAGHSSQKETNTIMQQLMTHDYLKRAYRYKSHKFVQKNLKLEEGGAPLLQTGDVLAWLQCSSLKRRLANKSDRKDYEALVYNNKHYMAHYDEAKITRFAHQVNEKNKEQSLIPHDLHHVLENEPFISWSVKYLHPGKYI